MTSALDGLRDILAPPAEPADTGGERWAHIELELGSKLPADYKEFIATYGTGGIDRFLYVLNPFTGSPFGRLTAQRVSERLYPLRAFRDVDGVGIPYGLYPEPAGLLPWGATSNNDNLCWHTQGDADEWSVVMVDSELNWDHFCGTMTECLLAIVRQTYRPSIFPDGFPSLSPAFLQ